MLFRRGSIVSTPPRHLTTNFFLDRGLDCISPVYKGVDPQVHDGQPKIGFLFQGSIPNNSQVPLRPPKWQ